MTKPTRQRADLQRQAKALGDPTRHEIFRQIVLSAEPIGVAELTAHFGLNHNAIRQHLALLVAAELVVESTVKSQGRGRPKFVYRQHPLAESRWGITGPYERLSAWLAEAVETGDTPFEVGRRDGRARPMAPDAADPADPAEALAMQMALAGFEPRYEVIGRDVKLVIGNCPFESVAVHTAASVCDIHHGIAVGVAEAIGGIEVERLQREDPRIADCVLHCRLSGLDPNLV
jgi:predicted ArsR family transcriptional regulator